VPALRASPSISQTAGEDVVFTTELIQGRAVETFVTAQLCEWRKFACVNSTGLMLLRLRIAGRGTIRYEGYKQKGAASAAASQTLFFPLGKVPGHCGRECQP
jgi:hypothetical protein